ncbi:cold shock domain-containing protein [Thiolapillus sp.]
MKGKITQWKDDKGFGFIIPDDGSEKVFFHISTVKSGTRRPQVGDIVIYEATRDSQNRLKARGVVIEGVASQSISPKKSKTNKIEPPQKNAFDYLLILVLLVSLCAVAIVFFQTQRIESAVPSGIPALIAIVLLSRQKKPKEKKFSCSRCRKIAEHDTRTIKAWNNGFLKLYCKSCHHQWLRDNPNHRQPTSRSSGGCLGLFVLLALTPIITGISLYQWLS